MALDPVGLHLNTQDADNPGCLGPQTVKLVLDDRDHLHHSCTCWDELSDAQGHLCRTQVDAMEIALDLLGTPQTKARQKLITTLTDTLSVPAATRRARRYLARLGLHTRQPSLTLDGMPAEPVWRLHGERDDGWHVTPGLMRAKKQGSGVVVRAWPMAEASQHLRRQGDARDRAVLELSQALAGFHAYDQRTEQATLSLQDQLLRHLVGHPALYLAKGSARQVTLQEEELRVRLAQQGKRVSLCTFVGDQSGSELLVEIEDNLTTDWRGQRVLLWPGTLGRGKGPLVIQVVHASPEAVRAARIERWGEHELPADTLPELRSQLTPLAQRGSVTFSEQVRGAQVASQSDPVVELGFDGKALRLALLTEPLAGGGLTAPGAGPREWYAMRAAEPVYCERDRARERQVATELWQQLIALSPSLATLPGEEDEQDGADDNDNGEARWSAHLTELDEALGLVAWLRRAAAETPDSRADRALKPPPEAAVEDTAGGAASDDAADAPEAPIPARWRGLQIRWDSAPVRLLGQATASGLKVELNQGRDWFGVKAHMEVRGVTVPLAQLLAAARDARRYVHVEGKGWLKVEEGLRRRLSAVAPEGGQLSPLAAPVLMALEEEGAEITGPTKWLQMSDRIRQAASLDPAIPAGLHATLRPYQRDGFAWLARLATWAPGAVLADDMGLGKTIQGLALLLRRAALGPALVVAPTSLGFNWQREAARFAPGLEVRALRGKASVAVLDELAPNVVVITSWDVAHLQVERLKNTTWATLVMDEAQAIKNPTTRRAKAMFALDADFRLALTGTPMENHTGELWSLFRATVPGLLGARKAFRERFQVPIERHNNARAKAALAALISPFLLRRLKSAVAQDLPPRTDVLLDIELSPAERRRYEQLRASVAAELAKPASPEERGQTRRFRVLAALTRLRQLACHPALVDPSYDGSSAKLDELLRRLDALREEGHRALVFSQFTSLLDVVRPALEAANLRVLQLDGRTPGRQRRALVDAFQAREADVFLLSIKAGGTGLNLTAASYVFHLDPWWNPAVEDQATDRAHRIGQGKQVVVYRLVARQTVEESIYALHDEKRALTDAMLSGASKSGPMAVEELEALLLSGGEAGVDEALALAERLDDAAERAEPEVVARRADAEEPADAVKHMEQAQPAATLGSAEELWFAPPQALSAAGVEALLALQARLEAALAAGEIAKRASARSVARRAGRYVAWLETTGLPLARVAEAEVARRFAAEVRAGRWQAPTTDAGAAKTTARWLGRRGQQGG